MSVFNTIICSINLIEHSDDIIYYTKELAKQSNAKVYVVHSVQSVEGLKIYFKGTPDIEHTLENLTGHAQKTVDEFVEKHFKGIDAVAVVLEGDPVTELLKIADKHCADVIIMGSMSTRGFFNFFNTKTSQALVGKTRIPVMVVPNDLDMDCLPNE